MLWLLLTGEVPTKEQADSVTAELHSRAKLPAHVESMIRSFPEGMHPMTQLSSAILALQTESVFAQKYAEGTNKTLYWAPRSPRRRRPPPARPSHPSPRPAPPAVGAGPRVRGHDEPPREDAGDLRTHLLLHLLPRGGAGGG